MSDWIKCADRMPDDSCERFLAFGIPTCGSHAAVPVIELCSFGRGRIVFGEYDCHLEATYWMPLPQPPSDLDNDRLFIKEITDCGVAYRTRNYVGPIVKDAIAPIKNCACEETEKEEK